MTRSVAGQRHITALRHERAGDRRGLPAPCTSTSSASAPQKLEHISWQEWFTAFEEQGLALCYPDPHIHGGTSAWFELVPRDDPRAAP